MSFVMGYDQCQSKQRVVFVYLFTYMSRCVSKLPFILFNSSFYFHIPLCHYVSVFVSYIRLVRLGRPSRILEHNKSCEEQRLNTGNPS